MPASSSVILRPRCASSIGVAMAWLLVAKRLNHESRQNQTITVPDFLSAKFQDKSNAIRIVSAVIILSMVAAYIAAQMLATGKAFSVFLGWEYATGVWVGGLVTVAYTSFGGFKAVAYTDAVQAMTSLPVDVEALGSRHRSGRATCSVCGL